MQVGAVVLPPVITEQKEFTYGLFGCFDDFSGCLYAWCCLPCLAAKNSARADRDPGSVCCGCCYPQMGPAKMRTQGKSQLTLDKAGCGDCLISTFCQFCSIVQIKREVEWREQNPSAPRKIDFEYGLFGCCFDPMVCLKTFFCCCCVASATSARMDGHPNFLGCCYECQGGKVRGQIRGQRQLGPPGCCPDYLIWCCCSCCMEIQLKRELDERDKLEQTSLVYAANATMVPVGVVVVQGQPIQQNMH
jgi:Cys-rich protein (TIGR01571 family)